MAQSQRHSGKKEPGKNTLLNSREVKRDEEKIPCHLSHIVAPMSLGVGVPQVERFLLCMVLGQLYSEHVTYVSSPGLSKCLTLHPLS